MVAPGTRTACGPCAHPHRQAERRTLMSRVAELKEKGAEASRRAEAELEEARTAASRDLERVKRKLRVEKREELDTMMRRVTEQVTEQHKNSVGRSAELTESFLKQRLEALEAEHRQLNERHAAATAELTAARNAAREAREAGRRSETGAAVALLEAQRTADSKAAEAGRLEAELKVSLAETEAAEKKLSRERRKEKRAREELERLRAEAAAAAKAGNAPLAAAAATAAAADARTAEAVARYKAEKERHRVSKASFSAAFAEVQAEVEQLRGQVATLSAELEEQVQAADGAAAEQARLQREVEGATAAHAATRRELEQQTRQAQHLIISAATEQSGEPGAAERQLAAAAEELAELRAEGERTRALLTASAAANDALQRRLQERDKTKSPPVPPTGDPAKNGKLRAAAVALSRWIRDKAGGTCSATTLSDFYYSHPAHKDVVKKSKPKRLAEMYPDLLCWIQNDDPGKNAIRAVKPPKPRRKPLAKAPSSAEAKAPSSAEAKAPSSAEAQALSSAEAQAPPLARAPSSAEAKAPPLAKAPSSAEALFAGLDGDSGDEDGDDDDWLLVKPGSASLAPIDHAAEVQQLTDADLEEIVSGLETVRLPRAGELEGAVASVGLLESPDDVAAELDGVIAALVAGEKPLTNPSPGGTEVPVPRVESEPVVQSTAAFTHVTNAYLFHDIENNYFGRARRLDPNRLYRGVCDEVLRCVRKGGGEGPIAIDWKAFVPPERGDHTPIELPSADIKTALRTAGVTFIEVSDKKSDVDNQLKSEIGKWLTLCRGMPRCRKRELLFVLLSADRDFASDLKQVHDAGIPTLILHQHHVNPAMEVHADLVSARWAAIAQDAGAGSMGERNLLDVGRPRSQSPGAGRGRSRSPASRGSARGASASPGPSRRSSKPRPVWNLLMTSPKGRELIKWTPAQRKRLGAAGVQNKWAKVYNMWFRWPERGAGTEPLAAEVPAAKLSDFLAEASRVMGQPITAKPAVEAQPAGGRRASPLAPQPPDADDDSSGAEDGVTASAKVEPPTEPQPFTFAEAPQPHAPSAAGIEQQVEAMRAAYIADALADWKTDNPGEDPLASEDWAAEEADVLREFEDVARDMRARA